MEQPNTRMISELNKLIGNTLIQEGGIYLPYLGSLVVITKAPNANGGISKSGYAPLREITISTDEQYRTLSELIAERGKCSEDQALKAYDIWFKAATAGDACEISGVGTISKGRFIIAPAMFAKLNPTNDISPMPYIAPEAPKQSVRRRNIVLLTLLIGAIALTSGLLVYLKDSPDVKTKFEIIEKVYEANRSEEESPMVENKAIPEEEKTVIVEETKVTEPIVEQPKVEEPKVAEPEPVVAPKPEVKKVVAPAKILTQEQALEAGRRSTGKYHVVYGNFSTEENVNKVLREFVAKYPDIKCSAYLRNGNITVTIFDATTYEEAKEFIDNNSARIGVTDMWVYKTR